MIKELTFTGKLEDGNPHKEYWWKQAPLRRLEIANSLILQVYGFKSWNECPMKKELTYVGKLKGK
jgi:hypothetical protein